MDLITFKGLKSVNQLASVLGYSYERLAPLIYGHTASASYRVFQISKRSGGYRTIAAPRSELKRIQREITEALTEAYKPTRSAFGFVRGRSIVGCAEPHVGRRVVVNVDISDFFPSITFWRVRGLMMSSAFGLPYDVATVVAQLCCRGTSLPQGAPTSPVISNFVCSGMDRDIGAIVGTCGGRYSRYCDDMTMSFDSEVVVAKSIAQRNAAGVQLNVGIERIINKHGFSVNAAKLKLRTRRERQEVTGLVVNAKVNVKRELVKLLHTQLHCVEKFGIGNAAKIHFEKSGAMPAGTPTLAFAAAIRGRILFVKMVRGNGDAVFAKLARRFNQANIYPRKIAFYERAQSVPQLQRAVWVVEIGYDDPEWGYCSSQGTAFFLEGAGLVTCAHVVINEKSNRPFREIEVFRTGSMRRYRAFVASFDPNTDLALLFVEDAIYALDFDSRLRLSPLEDLRGKEVLMVGFPSYRDGQSLFVSKTEVAALHGNMIEVGGQVVGGISGGPLLDQHFRVVGVLVRGIPGGGSKNEAIKAKMAFYLDFKKQSIEVLWPIQFPDVGLKPAASQLARLKEWLSGVFKRLGSGIRNSVKFNRD